MHVIIYLIIAGISMYLGSIDKKVGVAYASAPISLILAVSTVAGAIILLQWFFILLALLLIFISKLKFLAHLKIAAIITSIGISFLGLALGPPGWLATGFIVLMLLVALKDMFSRVYHEIFARLAQLLIWVRKKSDTGRQLFPLVFHPFIFLMEITLVCGLAAQALWHLLEWSDGPIRVSETIIIQRCIAIIPFTALLFKNYRKDTTPPNTGGEGIDVPLPSVMDLVQ